MPNEDREDIVVLTDDEGNEVEFLFLDAFEATGRKYAVLVPLEGAEDGEEEDGEAEYIEGSEAMIFRLEQDDTGEEVFVEIEDDDEWAEVTAAWEDLQDEDFEEDGDDDDHLDGDAADDADEAKRRKPDGGWGR